VTPERVYEGRRVFLRRLGILGLGAAGLAWGCRSYRSERGGVGPTAAAGPAPGGDDLYPARRNADYAVDRPLTDQATAARYNNFYEFTDQKDVWRYVERFRTRPWEVEVLGLCEKPCTFDLDDLARLFPLEERVYRHRCVEAWSMVVPWTGFPLRSLLDHVRPLSAARHVRMLTFLRPEEAPGQERMTWYPWPYYEGLTMEEARSELALLVTGIYGHALPVQHGAPVRLVTPWKYGFKSIKSIVLIDLVEAQPKTFWSDASDEYDFWANVNPNVPHPRWSQATERVIDTSDRIPTLLFNGYAAQVGHLYPWEPTRPRA
jgi:sulfoxide reductase catalytic subunit YedY